MRTSSLSTETKVGTQRMLGDDVPPRECAYVSPDHGIVIPHSDTVQLCSQAQFGSSACGTSAHLPVQICGVNLLLLGWIRTVSFTFHGITYGHPPHQSSVLQYSCNLYAYRSVSGYIVLHRISDAGWALNKGEARPESGPVPSPRSGSRIAAVQYTTSPWNVDPSSCGGSVFAWRPQVSRSSVQAQLELGVDRVLDVTLQRA
jgi:hypothetical protein